MNVEMSVHSAEMTVTKPRVRSHKTSRVRIRHDRIRSLKEQDSAITHDTDAPRSTNPHIALRNGRLVNTRPTPATVGPDAEPEAVDTPRLTGKFESIVAGAFVVSLMLPFSYNVGPLRLPPYMMMLLLLYFPLMGIWISGKKTRIILPDILMMLFCFWAAMALIFSAGFSYAAEPVGVHFLTTFGAYLTGRILVRDAESMRSMIRVTICSLILILPAVLIESFTGKKLLLMIAGLIGSPVPSVDIGARLGLTRAQGPFEHPILMGVFCSSLLSIAFYAFRDRRHTILRWFAAPASVIAGIMSLSTGALLSLNIQFGLMLWSRVLRLVRKRWRLLTLLLISAYVTIDLISVRTPFHVFVNYATFSSGSSYNRILIWQFGSAEALRHPFFGIGLGDWERPKYMSDSMDNFWLVQAVKFGLPAFAMLTASIIIILRRVGAAQFKSQDMILLRRGALFSIIGTMTAIVSVHLWNATYVWFIFLIGATAWMGIPPKQHARK